MVVTEDRIGFRDARGVERVMQASDYSGISYASWCNETRVLIKSRSGADLHGKVPSAHFDGVLQLMAAHAYLRPDPPSSALPPPRPAHTPP